MKHLIGHKVEDFKVRKLSCSVPETGMQISGIPGMQQPFSENLSDQKFHHL